MAVSNKNMNLKGINLSGAEYDSSNVAAVHDKQYTYPSNAEIDYYKSKGFTTIRVPFSGPRLQPVNNGALNTTELGRLRTVVNYAASKGLYVVLDPHDYGYKYDSVRKSRQLIGVASGVPASHFADFWRRLSTEFKSHPNVVFGLMNEPNKQSAKDWKAVAVAAITAIRSTGAKQLILIPGSGWDGAHSWISTGNAAAWAGFTEPANNFAFEVHQYLDSNSSGTSTACVANKGATALNAASAWARTNRFKLFLGEMGWASSANCLAEGAAMVQYMKRSADVWTGWTYWTGGKWVGQSYMFMLTPADLKKPVDKPQMKALAANL